MVRRAEAAGYRAIVLTADDPVVGHRPRDLRHASAGTGITKLSFGNAQPGYERPGVASWLSRAGAGLSWADLAWLCAETSLPVLVKGVLTAEDARPALAIGARGLVVSNHGAQPGPDGDGCRCAAGDP